MTRIPLLLLLLLLPGIPALVAAQVYFPDRHHWNTATPAESGFDAERLEAAVAFAREAAVTEPKDLHRVITDSFAPREPNFRILGPTSPRDGDSGVILKGGANRRRVGRRSPRRHDVQCGQELSRNGCRHSTARRPDRVHRRTRGRLRA